MAELEIYQLKDIPENRYRRWLGYDGLGKMGETPQFTNYEKTYSMQLRDTPTPEQVFEKFNLSRPQDFRGHSLSTSDIIVFRTEDQSVAQYVDNVSFVRLPDFERQLFENYKREEKTELVGYLRYLDTNEQIPYTDPDAYIAAYKEGLYDLGPNTVRAVTLTKDLGVRYEINKLLVGEFGETVPDKETWIKAKIHSNAIQEALREQARSEPDAELEL